MGDAGIYVAAIALTVESVIIWKIIREYLRIKEILPSAAILKELLLKESITEVDSNRTNLMAVELIDLVSAQHTTQDVRSVFVDYLENSNSGLKHLANLGPAAGLFFTFCGMFLTVLSLAATTTSTNADFLNQNLANLYPVFIGGAVGIVAYGLGTFLLSKLEVLELETQDSLLRTFIDYEASHEAAKSKSVEEAYSRLLRPLKALLTRLETINSQFQIFSEHADNMISRFSEKSDQLIERINNEDVSIASRAAAIFHELELSTESINTLNSKFSAGTDQLRDSLKVLNGFSASLTTVENRMVAMASIAEGIPSLVESMRSNSEHERKVFDWAERDRLDIGGLKREAEIFAGKLSEFSDLIQQLKLELPPTKSKLMEQLSTISSSLNAIQKGTGTTSFEGSIELRATLSGIRDYLEKLSGNGELTKAIPTEPFLSPGRKTSSGLDKLFIAARRFGKKLKRNRGHARH